MIHKVLRFTVKTLLYIFIALLLVYLFVEMRQIGYRIFSDKAKDSPEVAKEMVLTVSEDESLLEIGRDSLTRISWITRTFLRWRSASRKDTKNIQPGEYVVNSGQKPSEILAQLTHQGEQGDG